MTVNSQYRSTSKIILEPETTIVEVLDSFAGGLHVRHAIRPERKQVPDEAVLRLLIDLDLADHGAVRQFVQECGNPDMNWTADRGAGAVVDDLIAIDDLQRAVRSYVRFEGAWDGWNPQDNRRSGPTEIDGTSIADAISQGEFQADDINFALVLNTYLRGVNPPRLVPESVVPQPVPCPVTLAIQLHNLFVQNAEPRRCASEKCQTFFWKQQGRAKSDQRRRTGVKYCKDTCNKAQHARKTRAAAKQSAS